MTETQDLRVITDALGVIDAALAKMGHRELVSSGEVTDLLLDVRTLLTSPKQLAEEAEAPLLAN